MAWNPSHIVKWISCHAMKTRIYAEMAWNPTNIVKWISCHAMKTIIYARIAWNPTHIVKWISCHAMKTRTCAEMAWNPTQIVKWISWSYLQFAYRVFTTRSAHLSVCSLRRLCWNSVSASDADCFFNAKLMLPSDLRSAFAMFYLHSELSMCTSLQTDSLYTSASF